MEKAEGVQEKYNVFMEVYRIDVMRFVPKYKPREEGKRTGSMQGVSEQRERGMKHGKDERETEIKKQGKLQIIKEQLHESKEGRKKRENMERTL